MITHDSKGRVQLGPIEFVIQAKIGEQESGARSQEPGVRNQARRAYLLSFFGIVDLPAILPFDLSLGACYQVDHCGRAIA